MKNIGWTLAPMLAAGLLITALGCRESAESPTGPEPAPTFAATSAQALSLRQVTSGGSHSCGVTSDNRAYCWRNNSQGQLGIGTIDGTPFTPHAAPEAVIGPM